MRKQHVVIKIKLNKSVFYKKHGQGLSTVGICGWLLPRALLGNMPPRTNSEVERRGSTTPSWSPKSLCHPSRRHPLGRTPKTCGAPARCLGGRPTPARSPPPSPPLRSPSSPPRP